jgi:HK97 gp10 family phage protein
MPAAKHSISAGTMFGDTGRPGEITGLKELDAALKQLPRGVRNRMIRNGMKEAAQPVLDLAKAYAPVDTGKLRDKMRIYSARLGRKQRKVSTGATISWPKGKTSPAKYAAINEFGGNNRPARPFLRPAAAAAKPMVKQKFKQIMTRLVAEAAKEAKVKS